MPSPVISVSQMREWEQAAWAAGKVQSEVIARVGEIVAARARQMAGNGGRILILAGKGHNGDDARQAMKHLAGLPVRICEMSDPARALENLGECIEDRPELIIDGLFGIGLNRPLDAQWQALIERVNESQIPVLAVDVPSGLNADTGEPQGAAIRAAVTLTLGAPKQGLLLPAAWPYTGRLEVAAEIGLTPCPHTSELNWILPEDFHNFPLPRPAVANKGDFGRVAIVAGSLGFHGAGVLTSRGAQRAQPGLITVYALEQVYQVIASQCQAVMVGLWDADLKLSEKHNAILMGPGLAAKDLPDGLKTMAQKLWRDSPVPVVMDAGALDWLPFAPVLRNVIRVVTPHPGEAARLLHSTAQKVQANRLGSLREISRMLGNCWVVLKGAQTLIGRSSGSVLVNPSGNPHLAQGGSGDLLAGYLTGLLAQAPLQADPLKTIAYGVWQHGAAADRLAATRPNWVVEDLAAEIGNKH
jgi:hydroxyethylthiazole kinase-like uncharacterized protein yjeF